MSKLGVRKSSLTGQFQAKRSAVEDLATFQSVVTGLKSHPDKLQSVAVKAGITTASGRLKKAYKG